MRRNYEKGTALYKVLDMKSDKERVVKLCRRNLELGIKNDNVKCLLTNVLQAMPMFTQYEKLEEDNSVGVHVMEPMKMDLQSFV